MNGTTGTHYKSCEEWNPMQMFASKARNKDINNERAQTHTHKLQGKAIICRGGDIKKKNNIWRVRRADGSPPQGASVNVKVCVFDDEWRNAWKAIKKARFDLVKLGEKIQTLKCDTKRVPKSQCELHSGFQFRYLQIPFEIHMRHTNGDRGRTVCTWRTGVIFNLILPPC